MSGSDKIMMAVDSQEAVRQAEVLLLGQMRDTMKTMSDELVANRTVLATVREDVATIKANQTANAELKTKVNELETDMLSIKMRNAKQDGAAAFFTFLKDYGGWLAGLGGLGYGLFLHH